MIDMRWRFCRWPKVGKCQQGRRQTACVLAPLMSSPNPSWPSPAAARKRVLWPTRKTAREEGRTEKLRPFPSHTLANTFLLPKIQQSPRGHSRRVGLCRQAQCCPKVSGSVAETWSCVWSYTTRLYFCFLPRLFYECKCKT